MNCEDWVRVDNLLSTEKYWRFYSERELYPDGGMKMVSTDQSNVH